MSVVVAAAFGLALGVLTGMPLGVVNVAIVDAAIAGRRQLAAGIAIGGAIADTVHAALAFGGVGRLVTGRPEVVRVLAIAAGALIVGYAIAAWRRREHPRATIDDSRIARGIGAGVALTLPNPAALAAWVAVAAVAWPGASLAEAGALAGGVGVGSAAWFTLLGRWVGRARPDHRLLAFVPRAALVMFVAIAAVGVVRVL